MTTLDYSAKISPEFLTSIFPASRSDEFFEALFGDASEGSYDIKLSLGEKKDTELCINIELHQRPGCCLACNLTHGLPQVFSRHPLINIAGVAKAIAQELESECKEWRLGHTQQHSTALHTIPLYISL